MLISNIASTTRSGKTLSNRREEALTAESSDTKDIQYHEENFNELLAHQVLQESLTFRRWIMPQVQSAFFGSLAFGSTSIRPYDN